MFSNESFLYSKSSTFIFDFLNTSKIKIDFFFKEEKTPISIKNGPKKDES